MFYSQKIAIPVAGNTCARCETKFNQWSVYHAHVTGGGCFKRLLPVRTSNRTRAQIVADMENTKLKGVIIQ